LEAGRFQPLVQVRGGLGLPGLPFELMPLNAGWQFFGFRA
jgi:hypothetical protein